MLSDSDRRSDGIVVNISGSFSIVLVIVLMANQLLVKGIVNKTIVVTVVYLVPIYCSNIYIVQDYNY